eukprot:CAMPEP_0113874842 /NCGR_PEP_ID=MMETSP0780_2-20120614/4575_1 /TAXON_ID=652834 /ORGANISM="Palpitomonas bilix" /LENGTH=178 /DNA_ID=CAMNT_0000860693 /DNA_START=330 /DNA_END=866 /DNA_ORIENTATION=- /assembly_acc=CAM_ASM_000599
MSGSFTDGSMEEKYQANAECKYLIKPASVNHIVLKVDYMLLEGTYDLEACASDNVTIYDGNNEDAPVLAVLCGAGSTFTEPIVSHSSEVLVVFKSDAFVQKEGFQLSYESELCQGCQNGGRCEGYNTCNCLFGWIGDHCEVPVCVPACQNGGTCVGPNHCACLGYWEKNGEVTKCVQE